MKSKILNLTNSDWKAQKQWNKVGMKIDKYSMPKVQKIANGIAIINFIIPGTAGPLTSPIIIHIGRRMSLRERVKLQ